MRLADTKLKKTFIIAIGFIIIAITIIILMISPITKYLVEKYDEKLTGRRIKMDWIYVNPFTGYVHISNLKIYEPKGMPNLTNGDSIFFSAAGVSARFAMRKILFKTVEITELILDQPKGVIIQSKKDFNFNDLIKKFSPEKTDKTPSTVHFNILGLKIKNGTFYYNENVIPVNYFIKKVNLESTGKYWNADTIAVKYSFMSGTGSGSAKGNLTINFRTLDYRVTTIIQKFDLKFLDQYFNDITNFGTFSANLDADMKATGNLADQENLIANGTLAVNDFHFGKNSEDDYASFDKLALSINKLAPKKHQYLFDSLMLIRPYFKYERYDKLDNLQTMFGKNGANISDAREDKSRFNLILQIADYMKVLAKNFFKSDYKINNLNIYKGHFKFNDYSIAEKFSIEADPFFIMADSVNKNHKRVAISLKSGIQPYGNLSVTLGINPKDSADFDIQYEFRKLSAPMFNPYLITYTSFPLDRGTLELNGRWKVRNGIIKSDNHLLVIDPRLSNRHKNNGTKWVPTPLIMFFIRERGNVIDYKIPITGNLKSPKFHLHYVIFDILRNIFVKPPTTPYRIKVKNTESEIEKSLTLKWDMRQGALLPDQEKFVTKMADFLSHNPEASIAVYPMQYAEKEKEHILFFEAKKKYFLSNKKAQSLSEGDSVKVNKMSVKDSMFVLYLNKHNNDSMLFTIQEKCAKLIGPAVIYTKYNHLSHTREDAFMSYFKKKSVEKLVTIYPTENCIPYNGFSFYKIVYKEELPKALVKAYQQMNEFNSEAPRKKFKKDREKTKAKEEGR
jgi:hypothetical protein